MCRNKLSLNLQKTEYMIIINKRKDNKTSFMVTLFAGATCLIMSDPNIEKLEDQVNKELKKLVIGCVAINFL